MKTYKFTENDITYDIEDYDYGDKYWYLNYKLHRENGRAIDDADGKKGRY